MTLEYIGSLDAAFNDVGFALYDWPPPTFDYHGFDIFMEMTDLAPNEDFFGVQFDINIDPRFAPADFGWLPNTSLMYDPPGPPPAVPLFSTNADGGSNPGDLVRIVVITSGAPAAAALQPGEGTPVRLGTAYIQWTGDDSYYGGPLLETVPNGLDSWALYVNGVGVAQFSGFHGDQWYLLRIPEPSSGTLAALALGGLAVRVRRRR